MGSHAWLGLLEGLEERERVLAPASAVKGASGFGSRVGAIDAGS